MKDSIPLCFPEDEWKHPLSCRITERSAAMAVFAGITLIVGGGYHGKSTLLSALQMGVYDHIAGDGREFVLADETAVKLRAEEGRSIRNTRYFPVYQ